MKPTFQVIGVIFLLAILGPPYLALIGIAVWFGWSEKRRLARGLAHQK